MFAIQMEEPKRSKPMNQTQSKDSIFIIPQELIFEILLRLPVKCILKFRSVSKSWLALISSPKFIKTHLSNNKDHSFLMGFSISSGWKIKTCSLRSIFDNSFKAWDLTYPESPRSFWAVGSVNGLICLVLWRLPLSDLVIWNPSIRKYKQFPPPNFEFESDVEICGFGYDELHDDYKVVTVYYTWQISYRFEVQMFSLKGNSWRNIPFPLGELYFVDSCKFVNGKLHWTTTGNRSMIVSFDSAEENWGTMEMPPYGENRYKELEVLGSDLSVISFGLDKPADVWVMKEYGVKES